MQSRLQITELKRRRQINRDAEQTTDHSDIGQTILWNVDTVGIKDTADNVGTVGIEDTTDNLGTADIEDTADKVDTVDIEDTTDNVDTRAYWQKASIDQKINGYMIYRRIKRRAMITGMMYPGFTETTSSPAGNRDSGELLRDSLDLLNTDQKGNRYNRYI